MAARTGLYRIVPAIYLAVIALFLSLQFGTGRPFVASVSALEIRGVREGTPAADGSEIAARRVTLAFRGAELRFSWLRPLLVGRPLRRYRPVSLRIDSDGATVTFRGRSAGEVTLRFRVSADPRGGERLEIAAGGEEPFALPLECPGARVRFSDAVPAASIERAEDRLAVLLPAEPKVQWSGGYLYLSAPRSPVLLVPAAGTDLLTDFFLAQGNLVDEQDYERELGQFRDKAYRGWTQTRYLPEIGLWTGSDGQPLYSESLGAAFLAEACQRGEYARALASVLRAQEVWAKVRPASVWGGETGAYTGDLAAYAAARRERDLRDAAEATRLLKAGNPEVWRIEGLFGELEAARALAVLEQWGRLAAERFQTGAVDLTVALGMLETALDARQYGGAGAQGLLAWLEPAAERALAEILGAIRVEGGLARLASGDAGLALRTGRTLQRLGEVRGEATLAGLGRSLVLAVLRTADESGFTRGSEGRALAPEDACRIGRLLRYLPARRPLGTLLGEGAWVWSAAELAAVERDGSELRLVFSFVPGVPHYVLIQGLEGFAQLRLRGIPWRADPEFFRYFAGWFYDSQTQRLALKLTQNAREEQVVIVR